MYQTPYCRVALKTEGIRLELYLERLIIGPHCSCLPYAPYPKPASQQVLSWANTCSPYEIH